MNINLTLVADQYSVIRIQEQSVCGKVVNTFSQTLKHNVSK